MKTISRSQIKYVSTHPETRKLQPETLELGGGRIPLDVCWEGQGGQKCPLSIKKIQYITVSFQGALVPAVAL